MFIQIDKTNFINKGAELMLNAIVDRLSQEKALNPIFVHGRGWNVKTQDVRKQGLYQLLDKKRFLLHSKLIPQEFLFEYGVIKPEQINVMFNASGFSYGDSWESGYTAKFISNEKNYYKTLKKSNVTNILLPQAFGPFEKQPARDLINCIYPNINLIFARDKASYQYLTEAVGENNKIRLAPDFTNLCMPKIYKDVFDIANDSIIIIPNNKMVSMTSQEISEGYEKFLRIIYDKSLQSGKKIVLLNHEGPKDKQIIDKFKQDIGQNVEVLDNLDAKSVKGAINCAYMVISSRFHGVVSALSQGVPVLCTSWSHKYKLLLDDYEYQEGLLDVLDYDDMDAKISKLLDPVYNGQLSEHLLRKSGEQKILTENMWQEIIALIK